MYILANLYQCAQSGSSLPTNGLQDIDRQVHIGLENLLQNLAQALVFCSGTYLQSIIVPEYHVHDKILAKVAYPNHETICELRLPRNLLSPFVWKQSFLDVIGYIAL